VILPIPNKEISKLDELAAKQPVPGPNADLEVTRKGKIVKEKKRKKQVVQPPIIQSGRIAEEAPPLKTTGDGLGASGSQCRLQRSLQRSRRTGRLSLGQTLGLVLPEL
jgi:hypothetical protein